MNNLIQQAIRFKRPLSIFLIWLFTFSGMIGISLGHHEWFISKTPLNLIILFGLLVLNFSIDNFRKIMLSAFLFICGFAVEWVGVHYGFLFGTYHYGYNLGLKLDGVPLLIGVNWVMLVLATAAIARKCFQFVWLRVFMGAFLMVFLDYFIEPSAPVFDFWYWQVGHAPVQNFIAWFGIAGFLHYVYVRTGIEGDLSISGHVYLSQLVFFIYFFIYGL